MNIVNILSWTALPSPSPFSESKLFFLLSPASQKRNKNLEETKVQLICSQCKKKKNKGSFPVNACKIALQRNIISAKEDAESQQYKCQQLKNVIITSGVCNSFSYFLAVKKKVLFMDNVQWLYMTCEFKSYKNSTERAIKDLSETSLLSGKVLWKRCFCFAK